MALQLASEKVTKAVSGFTPGAVPTAKHPRGSFVDRLDADDQAQLFRQLSEPAECMYNDSFEKATTERELFGSTAKLTHRGSVRFVENEHHIIDAIATGERLPTLSHDEERHLFCRFNYARWRVAKILDEYKGKVLTPIAARHLIAWGHRVVAVRSIIVRINMPLVLAMGKRTKLGNIDFNDLVSEGNMALLRSVEKFDCHRGFKFSTYSCRAILKSFSRVAMRASRYRGKFPTEFDPAMERSDHLEQKRIDVVQDCVEELKQILLSNTAALNDVERVVVRERFALGPKHGGPIDAAPKTLEQVGRIIGVTKERVRQIQNNALRKIRATLENHYLAA